MASVNVSRLREQVTKGIERLPKVEGHGGEVQIGRDLSNLLNLVDKEAQKRGDEFIASVLFLLALTEKGGGEAGRLLAECGGNRKSIEQAEQLLPNSRTHWFAPADHDLHAQHPDRLAQHLIDAVADGFFSPYTEDN